MLVTRHHIPEELLARAGDWLRRDEAAHNLILGLCIPTAQSGPAQPAAAGTTESLWLSIDDDSELSGVAVQTPPHNLVLTDLSAAAQSALVDFLAQKTCEFPGVAGPSGTAAQFAAGWSRHTGRPAALQMEQRIYACRRVVPLKPSPGTLRFAEPHDRDLLIEWAREFEVAIGHAPLPAERAAIPIDRLLAERRIFIWDDAGPVSCARLVRDTGGGVAVSFVYSPPEHRGRGYATSCVAALTRRALEAGKSFCCLYTDLANPTSNAIYQRIGYRPVCDAAVWRFD